MAEDDKLTTKSGKSRVIIVEQDHNGGDVESTAFMIHRSSYTDNYPRNLNDTLKNTEKLFKLGSDR